MGYLQGWHPLLSCSRGGREATKIQIGFYLGRKSMSNRVLTPDLLSVRAGHAHGVNSAEWLVVWQPRRSSPSLTKWFEFGLVWEESRSLIATRRSIIGRLLARLSKMCSQPLHSAHWALYDIPPLSFIISNGSKTFHRASVSCACGCETAAAVDGWPGVVVQSDDGGKKIAGILFDSNSRQILEAPRGSIAERCATFRRSH